MKYVFVDFDGVLHGEEENTEYFTHSPIFCQRLLKYKDNFRIIVSSSWREHYEFEICVEAFEEPLRDIVIGATPILKDGFLSGGRYLEITKYCKKNNILDTEWIAIDDMDRLFPKNCSNLILVNPLTGLDSLVLDKVEAFLNS